MGTCSVKLESSPFPKHVARLAPLSKELQAKNVIEASVVHHC